MTRGITLVSGLNMDDLQRPAETWCGEILAAHPDDPYLPICLELWRLLSRKRGYYGCEKSPLENAMGVQGEGIVPWVYQLARIGEKCRRLRGMLESSPGTLAIRETLLDIAGHAAVAIACNEEQSK